MKKTYLALAIAGTVLPYYLFPQQMVSAPISDTRESWGISRRRQ